jgi:hypothetical protein
MPEARLDATLTETPWRATDGAGFPSASTSIPFGLNTAPQGKPICVSTGRILKNIQSPSAFVALDGIGTGDAVTMATTFYVRVRCPGWQAKITFANPVSPFTPIVSVIPFAGFLSFEPDVLSGYPITGVELQGSGLAEFYASGQQ